MDKYISFELSQSDAASSQFAHYSLGATGLLPYYFGSIAPVNIFLGENNSGKSRFMREIMKNNLIKLLVTNLNPHNIYDKAMILRDMVNDVLRPRLYDMEFFCRDSSLCNEELLDIVQGKDKGSSALHLKFDPDEIFFDFIKFIINNFGHILEMRGMFDITNKEHNQILNELKEFNFRIQRIRKLYYCFIEPNKYGVSNAAFHSDSIEYSGNGCTLKIGGSYDIDKFRNKANRKSLADEFAKYADPILDSSQEIIRILEHLTDAKPKSFSKTYVPTLRTARTFIDKEHNRLDSTMDVMKYTTVRDYELQESQAEIITGFELYDAILSKYAARNTKREDLINFQNFLSDAFFNGQRVVIVPEQVADSRGGNILITVGTQERDIHHLGDGIQAIILLLYPLFFAKEGEWFFIEEPETHLHPGFQRLFIKTITKNQSLLDKELTVFMTTHSNHILDFAIDEAKSINLFTFRKTQEENEKSAYQIQLTKQGDLESLNVLGVQNSSVFLSNCTIWLEGVTDRIYLGAYLKAYLAHAQSKFSLIEGLHYSFLEYAGSNVMHYDFEAHAHDSSITPQALHDIQALSISNRILLIADQDGGKKTKRDTQLAGQQHAGFEYQILEVREIENLLSKEVIVGALQKMYSKETFDVALLNEADYQHEYLGTYLRSKYPALPDNFAPADGTGTIGSAKKRLFAERAAETITSWADLTPAAQQLTEQVYQFIVGHNPRLTSN